MAENPLTLWPRRLLDGPNTVAHTSLDGEAVTVQTGLVGGETEWLPPNWGWAFRKCPSDSSSPVECGGLVP